MVRVSLIRCTAAHRRAAFALSPHGRGDGGSFSRLARRLELGDQALDRPLRSRRVFDNRVGLVACCAKRGPAFLVPVRLFPPVSDTERVRRARLVYAVRIGGPRGASNDLLRSGRDRAPSCPAIVVAAFDLVVFVFVRMSRRCVPLLLVRVEDDLLRWPQCFWSAVSGVLSLRLLALQGAAAGQFTRRQLSKLIYDACLACLSVRAGVLRLPVLER